MKKLYFVVTLLSISNGVTFYELTVVQRILSETINMNHQTTLAGEYADSTIKAFERGAPNKLYYYKQYVSHRDSALQSIKYLEGAY